MSKNKFGSDDDRVELVTKNGMSYVMPMGDKDTITPMVNNFKDVNRILEYMQEYVLLTIQKVPMRFPVCRNYLSGAASFVWENVYEYDRIFRHLMENSLTITGVICTITAVLCTITSTAMGLEVMGSSTLEIRASAGPKTMKHARDIISGHANLVRSANFNINVPSVVKLDIR